MKTAASFYKKPVQNRITNMLQDLNALKALEIRPTQPSDILSPPVITFKDYRCPTCRSTTFKLASAQLVSMVYGKVVHLKCVKCNTVTMSGDAKRHLQIAMASQ